VADFFKRYPLATVIGWAASALTLLIVLQGSGILTGTAAHYVDVAAAFLQVVLTWWAKTHVTPVIDPKDNQGNQLGPLPAKGDTGRW
jgi:hypothetical protein